MNYYKMSMKTPIGNLILVATDTKLSLIHFDNPQANNKFKLPEGLIEKKNSILQEAKRQLSEYFKGQRQTFDLPLEWNGTEFQNAVWKALTEIKYGDTKSYSELAEKVGSPKAVRAVGMTNGRNPIPIVVPCHRVIGKNGTLTGFAGGLEVKDFLLRLEQKYTGQQSLEF